MTIDQLPGEITIPTRAEIKVGYLRSYRIRQPDAETSEGTQPDLDASIFADALLALYSHAKIVGQNSVLEESRGDALDKWGEREIGDDARNDAAGATGFVTISTGAGGGTIFQGDEVREPEQNLRFECRITDTYLNGSQVPIAGIDTGPETNLKIGTRMIWTSPRPGINEDCTVAEQQTGIGLDGGRNAENDEEFIARIKLVKQTRAASGNSAEYQLATEETPAVAIQKAFAYPAIFGPGSMCVAFTLRPGAPGANRIPSAAQVATVRSHLSAQFPASDSQFVASLAAEATDVVFEVTFAETAAGFVDLIPWPPYQAPSAAPGAIVVQAATDALNFILETDDADYTGQVQPTIGQTIAFFDPSDATFKRKRMKTITGTGPWTITVETLNSASDENYTPAVGQRAMPWSTSLDEIATGVVVAFDALGPGEQFATFFDAGRRQKRDPRPATLYPATLTNKALDAALDISEVEDGDVLEGGGASPTVGTPGVLSNLLELGFVSVFAQ